MHSQPWWIQVQEGMHLDTVVSMLMPILRSEATSHCLFFFTFMRRDRGGSTCHQSFPSSPRTRPMVGLQVVDRSCMRFPSVDPGGFDIDSSVSTGVLNPTNLGLNRIRLERTERVFMPQSSIENDWRRLRMLSGEHDEDSRRSSYEGEAELDLHRP